MRNILILSVIAVGIIGFAYFALFTTPAYEMANEAKESAEELSIESAKSPVVVEPKQGVGTLESLRVLGQNLECAIRYDDTTQQTTIEGTYFVSEGNLRGDFLTPAPDLSGQVLSSVIMDGTTIFIWTDIEGELYGVKLNPATSGGVDVTSREPVPMNASVHYDCKPWPNVDRTVFIPPATVIFQDVTNMKPTGMEYGTVYEGEVP